MKNKQFDILWQEFSKAQTEAEQYAVMKSFMLTASLEDLLAWNKFLAEKGDETWTMHRQTGLSETDKEWYKAQFLQFDDLEKQFKMRKVA
jgi:hypothetical protein